MVPHLSSSPRRRPRRAGAAPGERGTTIWSYHPVTAAAAAYGPRSVSGFGGSRSRGHWSAPGRLGQRGLGPKRLDLLARPSGGIGRPGLTWLFGVPGAVLFYCFAGALVALPERVWSNPAWARSSAGHGPVLVAWRSCKGFGRRGFGKARPRPSTPPDAHGDGPADGPDAQPQFISSWVRPLAVRRRPGWAVELVSVVALAAVWRGS